MATIIDDCSDRLHAAGWSVGETCFRTNAGPVWQVEGMNGENQLLAGAPTQGAAWRAACVDGLDVGGVTALAVTAREH